MIDYEVTTVTNQPNTSSNITMIAIIIISVCFILIVGVIILYKKHKKSIPSQTRQMFRSPFQLLVLSMSLLACSASILLVGSHPTNQKEAIQQMMIWRNVKSLKMCLMVA